MIKMSFICVCMFSFKKKKGKKKKSGDSNCKTKENTVAQLEEFTHRNKVAQVEIWRTGLGVGGGNGGLIVKITVSLGKSWQCGPPLPSL